MSKKSWLLLFFVIAVISYFIASKLNPSVDPWITQNILTPAYNGIKGTLTAITSSPTWQTWIAPNIGWIGLFTGFIGGILVYRWATRKRFPWQKPKVPAFQPQSGPPPIASSYVSPPLPPATTTTPTQTYTPTTTTAPTAQPQPQPQPEKKEEATTTQ